MGSRHLVDSELETVLDQLGDMALTLQSLPDARESVGKSLRAAWPADFTGVHCESLSIRSLFGDHNIRIVVIKPSHHNDVLPTILHMHSGGMVLGAPEDWSGRNAELVRALHVAVVSVDYRLAPETRAPGNVEDCYSALAWIYATSNQCTFDRTRIALMGESAGGGLAASLALMTRDHGDFKPKAQFLVSPMLDDRTGADQQIDRPYGELVWQGNQNQFGWNCLLPENSAAANIPDYCIPSRVRDLSLLPATFLSVGAIDLFFVEGLSYAKRLADAGVPVEIHVYPGAFHGFELARQARISIQAHHNLIAALERFVS